MSQKEYKMSLMSISESNKLKEFIVFTLLIISGFVYKLKIQGEMSQKEYKMSLMSLMSISESNESNKIS